jgi:hypothetical protein
MLNKVAICTALVVLVVLSDAYGMFWVAWKGRVTLRVDPVTPRSVDVMVYCDPSAINLGATTVIGGSLANATSRVPVRYETIYLYFGELGTGTWTNITSVQTNNDGVLTYQWQGASVLPAGTYIVKAEFLGSAAFDAWTALAGLQISAARIVGDINGDGIVDILDAILLANAFDSVPGDSNWNPNADINGDNIVEILDAIILANNFGEGT